jgi:hypothetical protein
LKSNLSLHVAAVDQPALVQDERAVHLYGELEIVRGDAGTFSGIE